MINKILKDYIDNRAKDIFINYKDNNITYEDMAYAVEDRAKAIQAINIKKGHIAGIYLDNSLDLLEILFACIESQVIPLIIPSNFTSNEISSLSKSININYIITNWNKSADIKNNNIPIFPIEELSPGIGGCAPSEKFESNDNQIACMLLTSGTTGKPKIAQISIKNIIESCKAWNNCISFKKDDIYLNGLPLHHIGGLSIVFRALFYGFKVILVDKFEKYDYVNKIIQNKVTLTSLVPTMLSRLLQVEQIIGIHKILRTIILSGSYCSASLLKDAIGKKLNIYKAYGMTESCSGISGFWVKDNLKYIESSGIPHNNVNLKIENNHILVQGPMIIEGYYNDKKFGDWYDTYDIGHINKDGFLYVFGRDGQAISGGENIDVKEVKDIISSHPDIKDVFIKTVEDEEWGDKIVAYIYSQDLDEIRFKKWLKTLISNHKIPKQFIFINSKN